MLPEIEQNKFSVLNHVLNVFKYSQQVAVKGGLADVDLLRLVVDGVAKDVEGREWEVLAMGSAVLNSWFMVELSSAGGVVALLPAEAVEGEGLPVGDAVGVTCVTEVC